MTKDAINKEFTVKQLKTALEEAGADFVKGKTKAYYVDIYHKIMKENGEVDTAEEVEVEEPESFVGIEAVALSRIKHNGKQYEQGDQLVDVNKDSIKTLIEIGVAKEQ